MLYDQWKAPSSKLGNLLYPLANRTLKTILNVIGDETSGWEGIVRL